MQQAEAVGKMDTWSVRLTEGTKAEIRELLEKSGERPDAFVLKLMGAYKLHRAVQAVPMAAVEVNDMRAHMYAIEECYAGLIRRMEGDILSKQQDAEQIIADLNADLATEKVRYDEQMRLYRGDMEALTKRCEEAEAKAAAAEKAREASAKKEKSAQEALSLANELLEQYRGQVEEIEAMKTLKRDLADAKAQVLRLEAERTALQLDQRDQLVELREKHQEELARLRGA